MGKTKDLFQELVHETGNVMDEVFGVFTPRKVATTKTFSAEVGGYQTEISVTFDAEGCPIHTTTKTEISAKGKQIRELETKLSEAVKARNFKLAGEIQENIDALNK